MTQGLMWNDNDPIIRSIDENDVYKILMMYIMWKDYPNLKVRFGFKNRTRIPLALNIDVVQLREELEAVSKLRFTPEILAVFRGWDMFPEDFLTALADLQLVAPEVTETTDGQLIVQATGVWFDTTLWEIFVLCIVSELYTRKQVASLDITQTQLYDQSNERITQKVAFFNAHPEAKGIDMSLRRRMTGLWGDHATNRYLDECPGTFLGASNMRVARLRGEEAMGTNAHELPMTLTALARHTSPEAMRQAPYKVLKLWQRRFGHKSLIILDDAYGSDVFRQKLPTYFLEDFKGFRHDSGDPYKYGEDTIALYQENGVDPTGKLLIFSDGLNPQKAVELAQHFAGRIRVSFGMGTNLSNDSGFFKALSLVMKVIEVAGNPAVKLSNNLNKATGPADEVEYYKTTFRYTNTASEEVVY